MNKKQLFKQLQKETKATLLKLLEDAYDSLNGPDALKLFSGFYEKTLDKKSFVGRTVADIEKFFKDSNSGNYYEPFDINSKNFMDIPEETELWFDLMAEYFKKTLEIYGMGELKIAADCFSKLYRLYRSMERGEDIVFADEVGGHMLHMEHKDVIPKYIKTLAATRAPNEYASEIITLMEIDDYTYNKTRVYNFGKKIGDKNQKEALKFLVLKNSFLKRNIKKL